MTATRSPGWKLRPGRRAEPLPTDVRLDEATSTLHPIDESEGTTAPWPPRYGTAKAYQRDLNRTQDYTDTMPADVRKHLDRLRSEAGQAQDAADAARAGADRARAELVAAQAAVGTSARRVETLTATWNDARRQAGGLQETAQLLTDVADEAERQYFEQRAEADYAQAVIDRDAARANYAATHAELAAALRTVSTVAQRMLQLGSAERDAVNRIDSFADPSNDGLSVARGEDARLPMTGPLAAMAKDPSDTINRLAMTPARGVHPGGWDGLRGVVESAAQPIRSEGLDG